MDDGESSSCFCGLQICCCRCIYVDESVSILRELKMDEERNELRLLERPHSSATKRARKGIFVKK